MVEPQRFHGLGVFAFLPLPLQKRLGLKEKRHWLPGQDGQADAQLPFDPGDSVAITVIKAEVALKLAFEPRDRPQIEERALLGTDGRAMRNQRGREDGKWETKRHREDSGLQNAARSVGEPEHLRPAGPRRRIEQDD